MAWRRLGLMRRIRDRLTARERRQMMAAASQLYAPRADGIATVNVGGYERGRGGGGRE